MPTLFNLPPTLFNWVVFSVQFGVSRLWSGSPTVQSREKIEQSNQKNERSGWKFERSDRKIERSNGKFRRSGRRGVWGEVKIRRSVAVGGRSEGGSGRSRLAARRRSQDSLREFQAGTLSARREQSLCFTCGQFFLKSGHGRTRIREPVPQSQP